MIRLIEKDISGNIIFDHIARAGVTISEICEYAEHEYFSGNAAYVKVTVNNETYMELEF